MTTITNEVQGAGEEVRRLTEAARDALTDEMVTRLAGTAGDALELIDQVNRSGLAKAIPALAQMASNGDLERLVQLARVYGSAEDALTDEMVGRIAETAGEGLLLLDRLSRGGAGRLVEMMERMESSGALARVATTLPKLLERMDRVEQLLNCFEAAAADLHESQPAKGGAGGLWQLMRDAESQQTLQFLLSLGKRIRNSCEK